MRPSRKLVVGAAGALAFILLLLVLLPLLLSDRITERARVEIERSLDARVGWSDVDLSILRDFPDVTFRLGDLAVTGVREFDGDTLVAVSQLRVVLDLRSVLGNLRRGDPIVVREVELRRPVARLEVLEDGTANWDIVRERPASTAADTTGALALSLRQLVVRDGDIRLDDRQSDLAAALHRLELELDGDFTRDRFDLATRVRAGEVSLRFAGIPYLAGVDLALDTDVDADMRSRRFTFADDQLRLNDLVLDFAGSVGIGDSTTAVDLTFSAPSTDFGHILSLVPAIYANDFGSLQTSGTMSVSGRVQGEYGPGAFPALGVRATVRDGAFRYPDLPLPARDIAFDLSIDNPGGDLDRTVVTLNRLHLALGGRPLDARMVLRTPVSDPDVELELDGSVELADVGRTVKLEGVDELAGLVTADVAMRSRKSWVDAGQYDQVSASGTIAASRLALRAAALPRAVAVDSAALHFTPRRAELTMLTARIGNSDVRATGSIDNLIGFVLRDEELRAEATVASDRFDLDEWRSDDEMELLAVPPKVDLTLRATARQVDFGDLELTNARGGLRVKDQRLTVDRFGFDVLGGAVVASGYYETAVPTRPTFDLDLAVDSLDIPAAFASLATVQRLAPVARYARGRVSAELDLVGALGQDMTPLLDALSGTGALSTASVAIEGFPALLRLADVLHVEQLRNPTVRALQAAFRIDDGRLHVRPFTVTIGELALTASGSNGIDQTLDYDLEFSVPTTLLGASANQAITSLASRAGRVGLDLGDTEVVTIGAKVTGTINDPTVSPSFGGTAGSVGESVRRAVQAGVDDRVADVRRRADSVADEARRRAREEADRLVASAEEGAAAMRLEADSLAARVRREGHARADALVGRATNPAALIAARAAADRLRKETDAQADRIVREADERGQALVEEARRRGDALVPPDA